MKAIKDLLAKNKLEEAARELRALDLPPEIENEIILQTSRLYEWMDKDRNHECRKCKRGKKQGPHGILVHH